MGHQTQNDFCIMVNVMRKDCVPDSCKSIQFKHSFGGATPPSRANIFTYYACHSKPPPKMP